MLGLPICFAAETLTLESKLCTLYTLRVLQRCNTAISIFWKSAMTPPIPASSLLRNLLKTSELIGRPRSFVPTLHIYSLKYVRIYRSTTNYERAQTTGTTYSTTICTYINSIPTVLLKNYVYCRVGTLFFVQHMTLILFFETKYCRWCIMYFPPPVVPQPVQ